MQSYRPTESLGCFGRKLHNLVVDFLLTRLIEKRVIIQVDRKDPQLKRTHLVRCVRSESDALRRRKRVAMIVGAVVENPATMNMRAFRQKNRLTINVTILPFEIPVSDVEQRLRRPVRVSYTCVHLARDEMHMRKEVHQDTIGRDLERGFDDVLRGT